MVSSEDRQTQPYGLWPSPLTPKTMSQGIRLSDVQWDSNGDTLVWLEGRSDRGVLVAAGRDGVLNDLTTDLSVRAKVGYGGGDFTVAHEHVVFSAEGRLYRQPLSGGEAKAITPAFGEFASPAVSPDGKWVAFVHSYERRDSLGVVDAEGAHWPAKLVDADDFYMQPAWHPDGRRIAFVAWSHPQMPWDGTEIRMLSLDLSRAGLPLASEQRTISGGVDVACFQPAFSPDGRYLAYVSDATGWGQVYVYDLESGVHKQLTFDPVEHGTPAWVQGVRRLAWSRDGSAVFALRDEQGFVHLWRYGLDTSATRIETGEYTWMGATSAAPHDDTLALIASAAGIPPRVITLSPSGGGGPRTVRRSYAETIAPQALSTAQALSWSGSDGEPVYGLYYAPAGGLQEGRDELPPTLIMVHGGPTSHRSAGFYPDVQFFTSRGYAVLQVNYRGSTSYGRDYMLKLRGGWGLYDREDAVSGAQFLVDSGLADPRRLVVEGGSAGGTTVLMALIHNPGFFRAGVCLFGVSNMFTLASDTHKFEERYLDTMLGPLPQARDVYRERSAIYFADKIQDPLIIFQGDVDQVVPRDQSDTIVASLRKRGIPHEYHVYEGEGHGWRKSETVEAYFAAAERFLRQHVVFA